MPRRGILKQLGRRSTHFLGPPLSVLRLLLKKPSWERSWATGRRLSLEKSMLQNRTRILTPLPTRSQLRRHFLNAMAPMIGFGFMDNLIMLQAGELIDTSIGVMFGLSTLTAAAVGQVFSDVSGVCFGGVTGALAGRLGLPTASFTPAQKRLSCVKAAAICGRVGGVVMGCTLGMSSLLFMDLEESQRKKRFHELRPILATIVRQTKRSLGVKSCRVHLLCVNSKGEEILFDVGEESSSSLSKNKISEKFKSFAHHFNRRYTKSTINALPAAEYSILAEDKPKYFQSLPPLSPSSGCWDIAESPSSENTLGQQSLASARAVHWRVQTFEEKEIRSRKHDVLQVASPSDRESLVSYVARSGHAVLCLNRKQAETTDPNKSENGVDQQKSNATTKLVVSSKPEYCNAVLCYPIFDDIDKDRVIGVIELSDKRSSKGLELFTRDDERLVKMLSEHLSLYLAIGAYYKHKDRGTGALERLGWICPVKSYDTSMEQTAA